MRREKHLAHLILTFSVLLTIVFLIVGCAHWKGVSAIDPYRFYTGVQKSMAEIALLESDNITAGGTGIITIYTINGRSHAEGEEDLWGRRFCIELLPGNYTLSLSCFFTTYGASHQSRSPEQFSFTAQAGHVYILRAHIDGNRWWPIFYDATDNEIADACVERSSGKMQIQDFNGAIADCNRAIELRPDLAMAFNNRGISRIATGDTSNGCADLEKAAKLGVTRGFKSFREQCKCKISP